ncbi:LOW QUALITY PROTEIN: uncharacterized protein LOC110184960 [Drosophila serrata]|uniref:LOW QUALITY PROTEIN: uncharacterized protein LOC110184960 n=1 Tax=Drosophila serrata TaxID=7274 RepID=UPI000A1CFF76|nr:LOW QUALITY PROTEIN: uncharacterized protein LOC110184960 [Drosophila serrata]
MNNNCCCTQTEECNQCQSGEDQKKGSLLHMVVGPFPDEVFMNILDGIILLWGAIKIKNMGNVQNSEPVTKEKSCLPPHSSSPQSSCPPLPSCTPTYSCSTCSLGRVSSFHTICCSSSPSKPNDCKERDSTVTSSPKSVCFKGSNRISAAANCPRQLSARVDFKHPADDIRKQQSAGGPSMKERLMQAEIVCSAACDALKTRLAQEESRSECKGQKWLWTKLIRTKNGCQVYEVYKDSNANCSPSKIGSKTPAMVFLVLRNGHIMPFESIKTV